MNSPALNDVQTYGSSRAGDSARGLRSIHAPVRPNLLSVQDFKAPETGGGRHKLPSFFQVSQPRCLENSPPGGAGRGLSALPQALPTFEFVTADHILQDQIEPSPSAHQCASFAATNHAAKGFTDAGKTFPRA